MKKQGRNQNKGKANIQQEVAMTEEFAIMLFYNPEVAKEFAAKVTQDQRIINCIKKMLKKGIRDIINITEDDLLQRGFLQGSVLFKPVLDNIADLIISAGSKFKFYPYFLTFYEKKGNMKKFEDLELINLYNYIIDLWTENKVSQKVNSINIKKQQESTQQKKGKMEISHQKQQQKAKKQSKNRKKDNETRMKEQNKNTNVMIDERNEIKPQEPEKEKLTYESTYQEIKEKEQTMLQVLESHQTLEKPTEISEDLNDVEENIMIDEEDWKSDNGEFWSKQPEDASSQGWQTFKMFTQGIIKPDPRIHNREKCSIKRVCIKVIDYGQGNLKYSYFDSFHDQLTRVLLIPQFQNDFISGDQPQTNNSPINNDHSPVKPNAEQLFANHD